MHSFRPLTQADLPALLDFESSNRAYFEKWVPPRPDWFFKDTSQYQLHMEALLKEHQNQTFLMYILVDFSGKILGRINLTISEQKPPSLGYRIAPAHTGQGLATAAIGQICSVAKATHGHSEITAQAARTNLASQRALISNGFSLCPHMAQEVKLNGQRIWLELFYKPL